MTKMRRPESFEVATGTNWFRVVLDNRMGNPPAGITGEDAESFARARRTLFHIFDLSQNPSAWDETGGRERVSFMSVRKEAERMILAARSESRRLTETEEKFLLAALAAFGIAGEHRGVGDLLAIASFQSKDADRHRADAVIEKIRVSSVDPSYVLALDAIAPMLRLPNRS